MRILLILAAALALAAPADAQMLVMDRDALVAFTSQNPFERFPDGRPNVPDPLLERLKEVTSEDAWGVLRRAGFRNQWEGGFRILHPGRKLVGRVVTAQFMPLRPDVNQVIDERAAKANLARAQNERVIELLQPGDVVVVDLFGKVENGTFVGSNLATAIFAQSRTGFVIDGSVRDLEGIFEIPMAAYFRDVHPTPIGEVMLTGINIPVRIGGVTVMPGDVALGDREGVTFIPPHLVQQIVESAEATAIKDEFTQVKIKEGKHRIRDVYPMNEELQKEFEEWKKRRGK